MRRSLLVAIAALLAAGCGVPAAQKAPGTPSPSSMSPIPTMQQLLVRVTADQAGIGCTQDHYVANADQLIVNDGEDRTVATGTFHLSPGAESCDWTATATVPGDVTFYKIATQNGELRTVPHADLANEDWEISFNIDVLGHIQPTDVHGYLQHVHQLELGDADMEGTSDESLVALGRSLCNALHVNTRPDVAKALETSGHKATVDQADQLIALVTDTLC